MAEKFSDQMKELFKSLPLKEKTEDDDGEGGFEVVVQAPSPGMSAGGTTLVPDGRDHRGQVLLAPLTEHPVENTRGKKMVPVAIPAGVEAGTFKKVLAAAYRTYLETGRLNIESIAAYSGVDKNRVTYLTQQEEFTYALKVRGVDTENTSGLTAEQDAALLVLTDTTKNQSWNQRMRAAGISQAKFNAWMKNPAFARALSGVSEALVNNHNTALLELTRRAGDGDLKAIQLQLAVSGRYDANQQSTVDALVLINKMMEVLTKHLSGQPEILMAVSKDMREIGQEVSQVNRQQIGGL